MIFIGLWSHLKCLQRTLEMAKKLVTQTRKEHQIYVLLSDHNITYMVPKGKKIARKSIKIFKWLS